MSAVLEEEARTRVREDYWKRQAEDLRLKISHARLATGPNNNGGNLQNVERLKLEQKFEQPGGYQGGWNQLITDIGVLHNSVSKFNATALSQSSQTVEAKKEDESIDTTVTVKHGGHMIVFHASENYRFNQLLDDACLYWQHTTAGGERLPSAYLQDGFGVEWPNSELVLSTLYARARRSSERRTTGLLADSASNSKPEIILALRPGMRQAPSSDIAQESGQSFYGSGVLDAEEGDERESAPFLSHPRALTGPSQDTFNVMEMDKWVTSEEMELWRRRSQNARQFALLNPACLFEPLFSLKVETEQYSVRVACHCVAYVVHLFILAAIFGSFFVRLDPAAFYDTSVHIKQQLTPDRTKPLETHKDVYDFLKGAVPDTIYANASTQFIIGRPSQRLFLEQTNDEECFTPGLPPVSLPPNKLLVGGCLSTFPSNGADDFRKLIADMESQRKLERSSAVIISFSAFRPESKMLVSTRLTVAFLPAGSIHTDITVSAYATSFYYDDPTAVTPSEVAAMVCDLLLVLFCLGRLADGCNNAQGNVKRYFSTLWYSLDVLVAVLAVTLITCMFVFDNWYSTDAEMKIFEACTYCTGDACTEVDSKWKDQQAALRICAETFHAIVLLYALLLVVMVFLTLRYQQGNVVVSQFWRIVRSVQPALTSFVFVYCILQFGFLVLINLVYGMMLEQVDTVGKTVWVLLKCLSSQWMFSNYEDMYQAHPVVTVGLYCVYTSLQLAFSAYLLGLFVHAYLDVNRAEAAKRLRDPASAFPRDSLEFWSVFFFGLPKVCREWGTSEPSRAERLRNFQHMIEYNSKL